MSEEKYQGKFIRASKRDDGSMEIVVQVPNAGIVTIELSAKDAKNVLHVAGMIVRGGSAGS